MECNNNIIKIFLRTLDEHIPIMQSHKKPSSLEFLRTPNFQHRSINSTFLRLCVCFVLFFVLFYSQGKLLTSLIEASIIEEKKILTKIW